MGTPLKIKIRQLIKEVKCKHLNCTYKLRGCGYSDFILGECQDCGKMWVE